MEFRFLLLEYEKDRLARFLHSHGLDYEDDINDALVCEVDDEIIASTCIAKNIVKCIAINNDYQGLNLSATLMHKIQERLREKNINRFFIFTKPCNEKIFSNLGFFMLIKTPEVALFENSSYFYNDYKQNLAKHYKNAKKIGSIVMNLNPMSKGHLYLIKQALNKCDLLHIFIVSEDSSEFLSETRFNIAKNELKDYKNIILHKSGDYIISKATFPTYFIKDKACINEIYTRLDVSIFARLIAPILGINIRFVGSELNDKITKDYNEKMQEILKEFNINYCEIDRLTHNGDVISASRIRKIIKTDKNYLKNDELKALCANSTYEYLKSLN